MMESAESPLDVLSRAATMVQENQALSSSSDDSTTKSNTITNNQQKQTTKWKRDRRARLPEYTRKSDPKFNETFNISEPSSVVGVQQLDSSNPPPPPPPAPLTISNGASTNHNTTTNGHGHHDHPLDMSLRQRGQPPPSYAQTISNPGYRSSYRPSVIHNGGPICGAGVREELPSGISMCDPIIDEHFRRSLGSDYHTVFQNNNIITTTTTNKSDLRPVQPSTPSSLHKSPPNKYQQQKPTSAPPSVLPPPLAATKPTMTANQNQTTRNVIEMMDTTTPEMSVDDHFAKALGDTWAKLNMRKKEAELKRDAGTKENNLVSI